MRYLTYVYRWTRAFQIAFVLNEYRINHNCIFLDFLLKWEFPQNTFYWHIGVNNGKRLVQEAVFKKHLNFTGTLTVLFLLLSTVTDSQHGYSDSSEMVKVILQTVQNQDKVLKDLYAHLR